MSLQSLANQHRQAILARETLAATQITGAWHAAFAGLLHQLSSLFAQMESAETVNLAWLLEAQRLQRALDAINGQMGNFSSSASSTVQGQASQAQQFGVQDGRLLVQFGQPMVQAQAPLQQSLDTGPIVQRFAQMPADAVARGKKTLLTGVSLGWGPRKIASKLQYDLGIQLRDALRISRTEAMNAYRGGTFDIYRANSDVVIGWEWLTSGSACPICAPMNGTKHDLSENMDEHPNGRCCPLPITRNYEEIAA